MQAFILLVVFFTFLNAYKSVSLLYDHILGMFFGSTKGSTGCQYSTKPSSSAEITVLYRSLNWKAGAGNHVSKKMSAKAYRHDMHRKLMHTGYDIQRCISSTAIVQAYGPRFRV